MRSPASAAATSWNGRSRHPDLYLAACECLGVIPERALAIEDSGVGALAAKAAGLRCIAVPGPLTAAHDFGLADRRLGSLAECSLEEVLRDLEGAAEAS